MPDQKVINFGIIGGGLMGREFASAVARWAHLTDFPARPRVVAVASRSPSSFDWFTRNFDGVRQTTTNYRELLADPGIDAIYCAVPHDLHERMYVDVLNAGKHLLGEKPFGIDLPANERIMEVVRRHPQLVVQCSSEFPFFPGVQRIAKAIHEDRFGRTLEVECGFLHASDMDPIKPINWKRRVATNGDYGCMGDLGLHVWHVPLRAGWMPRNVRAILSNVMTERPDATGKVAPCDTWDNATLFCEVKTADQHFPLTAKTQRIAPGETNTWYLSIKGTKFSARFSTREPRTLETMSYERGKLQAWCSEALGYESIYKTITGGIFEFGFADAMQQMIAAFCDQIVRGPAADLPFGCATAEEAHRTHRIFTAALKSHATSQVVEL